VTAGAPGNSSSLNRHCDRAGVRSLWLTHPPRSSGTIAAHEMTVLDGPYQACHVGLAWGRVMYILPEVPYPYLHIATSPRAPNAELRPWPPGNIFLTRPSMAGNCGLDSMYPYPTKGVAATSMLPSSSRIAFLTVSEVQQISTAFLANRNMSFSLNLQNFSTKSRFS
jgi:hypothetical protein